MTTQTTKDSLETTVDTYLAAWVEPDADQRAQLIDTVWAEQGRLVDPPMAAEGRAGISEMAAAFQVQFPGLRFRRASSIDIHHEQFRFAWEMVGPDGAVALTGMDVGEVGPDGQLTRITGFFGDLPSAAAIP